MKVLIFLGTLSIAPASVRATQAPEWFAASGQVKAVVLVAHGLNLMPSRMNFLSRRLAANGFEVYRMKLEGHGDSLDAFKNVTRETWLRQMRLSIEAVRARAALLQVPTYVVAYSLGALVYQDAITRQPELAAVKHVYFAPALTPRSRSKLVQWLSFLGPRYCLKSFSPEAYRAHDCTPLAAYKALFASVAAVEETNYAFVNLPSLVIGDANDELVSISAVRRLIANGTLSKWELLEVSNEGSTLPKPWHHLLIDQAAAGPAVWSQIEAKILSYLK